MGDKADYEVILPVVKRLRSEPIFTDEVRSYLQNMAQTQKKHGWIKSHPNFAKGEMLDDSIARKVSGMPKN